MVDEVPVAPASPAEVRGPSTLWITAEEPSPDLGGGNIRQAHLVQALADRVPTDLLLVGELRYQRLRDSLRHVVELRPPKARPPSTRAMRHRLWDLVIAVQPWWTYEEIVERRQRRALARRLRDLGPHDVVMVEHAAMARVLPRRRRGRWVLTLQNIPSVRARQSAALAAGPRQRWLWSREAARCRRLERWAMKHFDAVVTVCDEDATELDSHSIVISNGVDLTRFTPSPMPDSRSLVITGSMSYGPNIDGAQWFCREVFPHVRSALPDVSLTIAGRSPSPEVLQLAELERVSVVPDPPNILPYLTAARVAVVPLRVGTGTRLKALEAMACARPVVGTSIGLAGLGLTDRIEARVEDEPLAMADAIVELLMDDAFSERLAEDGRRRAEQFSWTTSEQQMIDLVLELSAR